MKTWYNAKHRLQNLHVFCSVPVPSPSAVHDEPTSVPGLSLHQSQQSTVVQPAPTTSIQPNMAQPSIQPPTVVHFTPNVSIQQPVSSQPNAPVTAKPPVASRGPLTKAEVKRLQWQKERGELYME